MYNPPSLQKAVHSDARKKKYFKRFKRLKVVQIGRQQQYLSFVNSNGQILDNHVVKRILKALYIYEKGIQIHVYAYVHT